MFLEKHMRSRLRKQPKHQRTCLSVSNFQRLSSQLSTSLKIWQKKQYPGSVHRSTVQTTRLIKQEMNDTLVRHIPQWSARSARRVQSNQSHLCAPKPFLKNSGGRKHVLVKHSSSIIICFAAQRSLLGLKSRSEEWS
ncbi:hypothetical protein CRM22_010075 [Opisthorchis felineus]|uniref:Uncharacterized protein n=1 Tax=Opisthorchis felineus TaxID=147828 RepID=A0A4S2L278_OPIFE|nr:hypothetical protein CRM22_010075 [Opisthorchis felineus]